MQAVKGQLYGGAVNGPLAAVRRIGGQTRAIWNHFLAQNVARYEAEQKFVFYAEMSAALPSLLKNDPRFAGCPHRAAQMTVQKLERALRECGRGAANRKGFPKFKRHSDRSDAFSFVGRECRFGEDRIRLPKIGWVRVRGLVLPEAADAKVVTVTQEPNGWHVSVQFEAAAKVYASPRLPTVGIDAGLAELAVLSDGSRIAAPRLARKAEKHIRRLNRERDRRRKGSVNRRRTVARLARMHRRVRNARQNFLHQQSRKLVDRYSGFAVEDLALRGMARTQLGKSVGDAAIGEFYRMLRYKGGWGAREWRVYPRFSRSTGVCPVCGMVGRKLALAERRWGCEGCGSAHGRDVAAARVILGGAVGRASPKLSAAMPKKRSTAVCGGDRVSVRSSHCGSLPNVACTKAIS